MENIYIILLICIVFWYFVHLRRVAEFARQHASRYCKSENLQFISIARNHSNLAFSKKHGPHWRSNFSFEFSGDGESSYIGTIILRGYKLDNIEMPAYRI